MIREAFKRVKDGKFITTFISENFAGVSLNEKSDLEATKKKICGLLKHVDDYGVVNNIVNNLYTEYYDEKME